MGNKGKRGLSAGSRQTLCQPVWHSHCFKTKWLQTLELPTSPYRQHRTSQSIKESCTFSSQSKAEENDISKGTCALKMRTKREWGLAVVQLWGFQDTINSWLRSRIPKLIQEVMVTHFSNADVRKVKWFTVMWLQAERENKLKVAAVSDI